MGYFNVMRDDMISNHLNKLDDYIKLQQQVHELKKDHIDVKS